MSNAASNVIAIIEAYVPLKRELVYIEYPEHSSEWFIRSDCGSYAQQRWETNDQMLQCVVKHSACENQLVMRPPCRNCANRSRWHQQCKEPYNYFYILVMGDHDECLSRLEKLVKGKINSSNIVYESLLIAYHNSQPWEKDKIQIQKDNERTRKSIMRIKLTIDKWVTKNDMCKVLLQHEEDPRSIALAKEEAAMQDNQLIRMLATATST
tara:strand:- start:1430 stop:2059 length:630 start_codon:yes stop_codon:yes gene_type:complete